ncbi:hypothetical protein QC763_310480 [Podospora pseudopauciseta]|uniref:AA1-like domain-containing protein n=2 Tax=Podospora TaxID=5144 RepID=A0ABR0HIM2_9PEZI|nr:hypothetical protein QC763_310480 [Podospora pseudopauciseta]KAK4678870.1 hypothetical protein QC764_310480 [Podospora pseudoanserina]
MAPSIVSIAALAALLSPAIPNILVIAQLTAGCTTNSFTVSSWLIEDFDSSGTTVRFQALNRATNTSAQLSCQVSRNTSTWQACTSDSSRLIASVQLEAAVARVRINETWVCNDLTPSRPLNFAAQGEGSLPITCNTDACAPSSTDPLLIKSVLSSPFPLSPSAVPGPSGHDKEGCAAGSRTPSWEIFSTQLNLRNVSGRIEGGNAFIQLRNTITDYRASCFGTLTGTAPATMQCSAQSTGRPRAPKYNINTVLTFSPGSFVLSVNETWFCDDANPAQPIEIFGVGTARLPLECSAVGETTTYCAGDPATFTGRLISEKPIPPFSLGDPLPTAPSCTISSVVAPSYRFSDFETIVASGSSLGSIRFGVELNTGAAFTGYPSTFFRSGVSVSVTEGGSTAWYPCVLESVGEQSLTPTACAFRYDAATQSLSLSADWKCSDLDASRPVSFTGDLRTTVPSLTCSTTSGRTRCATAPGQAWAANVTSVYWGN